MLKARAVVGGDDQQRLVEDALRREAVQKLPDEPIRKPDLQQVTLLQNPGEPRVAVEKQSLSALPVPLIIWSVVTVP